VQIEADPDGAAALVQDCLEKIGDLRLPGTGLPGNNDHDRPGLYDRSACRSRKEHAVQHVGTLLIGKCDRASVSSCHHLPLSRWTQRAIDLAF
jgi:hypothetical protein